MALNRIDKSLIDTSFKEEILQDTTNKIGVLNGQVTAKIAGVETQLAQTSAQLLDTTRQTSVLSQGTSVVSASVGTLANVEIEGRTLINLLGRLGRTTLAATIVVESVKYYVFVKINQTTGVVAFVKYTGQTSLSLTWASGEYAALYEVELANYTKIGLEWDSVAVGLRYPYVDDVKHLQGVGIVAEGDNLLPPFTEWTANNNSKIVSPYTLEMDFIADWQVVSYVLNVTLGNTYIVSGNGSAYLKLNKKGNAGSTNDVLSVPLSTSPKTFTVDSSYDGKVLVRYTNATDSRGKQTISEPMLTLGSVAKPFVPRNPSSVFADVKLGKIGSVADTLYEQDGRWKIAENTVKGEVLTLSGAIATLSVNAVASSAIIVDNSNGDVYKRVIALSGTGKEFMQSGANNKTITFNATVLPTSPIAHYLRSLVVITDITDKVEGSLKVNGLTQIIVDSGYRRTVVDGKSTWVNGSKSDYTANPVAVKLTYANSVRNAVDDAVVKVQDNTNMLSVHEKAIVDLYVRVKALEVKL